MRIWCFYNADGSTSGACGNATRCIARHLMDESGKTELTPDHRPRRRCLHASAGNGLTSSTWGTRS